MEFEEYWDWAELRSPQEKSAAERAWNAALESMQPEKSWPQEGDKYWTITDSGNCDYWLWGNHPADNWRVVSGNCFRTKQEAEQARDQILLKGKILKMLKELNGDWKADWGDESQTKWSICWDYKDQSAFYEPKCVIGVTKHIAKSTEIWQVIIAKYGDREVAECLGMI